MMTTSLIPLFSVFVAARKIIQRQNSVVLQSMLVAPTIVPYLRWPPS